MLCIPQISAPLCLCAILPILAALGCSKTTNTGAVDQPLPPALEGIWKLIQLDGKPVPEEPPVTFTITGDNISIKGPVNRINGTVTGGSLGPMMSTRMAGPPELMKYEQELLAALEAGAPTPGPNETLLFKKTDQTVATLKRQPGDPSD